MCSRVITQHWLAHALQHGDLGRILDPILLLLLHPITARVSIHYLYTLLDSKVSTTPEPDGKSLNSAQIPVLKEIGSVATVKPYNKALKRKADYFLINLRASGDSRRATSPTLISETEQSTDTDGAEADDENEENDPRKGRERI